MSVDSPQPPAPVGGTDLQRAKLLRLLDDFFEAKAAYIKKPTARAQTELRFAVENIERNFEPTTFSLLTSAQKARD